MISCTVAGVSTADSRRGQYRAGCVQPQSPNPVPGDRGTTIAGRSTPPCRGRNWSACHTRCRVPDDRRARNRGRREHTGHGRERAGPDGVERLDPQPVRRAVDQATDDKACRRRTRCGQSNLLAGPIEYLNPVPGDRGAAIARRCRPTGGDRGIAANGSGSGRCTRHRRRYARRHRVGTGRRRAITQRVDRSHREVVHGAVGEPGDDETRRRRTRRP